jgi:hypothetical protein
MAKLRITTLFDSPLVTKALRLFSLRAKRRRVDR